MRGAGGRTSNFLGFGSRVGIPLAAVQQAGASDLQHTAHTAAHGRAVRATGCKGRNRGGLGRDET